MRGTSRVGVILFFRYFSLGALTTCQNASSRHVLRNARDIAAATDGSLYVIESDGKKLNQVSRSRSLLGGSMNLPVIPDPPLLRRSYELSGVRRPEDGLCVRRRGVRLRRCGVADVADFGEDGAVKCPVGSQCRCYRASLRRRCCELEGEANLAARRALRFRRAAV